ncbi:type I-E CRISPR-associated protein Cse1/CasA [Corynebacterium riegelii]
MDQPDNHLTFNLLEQPWIICVTPRGTETLSIRQVFDGTATPTQLLGDSPTQDYAVLRVLLAIFWRAHQGTQIDTQSWEQWFITKRQELREEGRDSVVLEYLDRYQSRFDLFDPETPFMQVATLDTSKATRQEVSRILPDAEHNYFTMRTHEGRRGLAFDEAARWLIHTQAYDYSGIKSGAIGDPRVKGGRGYPIGTGWSGMTGGTVIRGRSLLETLLLNTTLAAVSTDAAGDLPVWEREADTAAQRNDRLGKLASPLPPQPQGAADLATWQSRRIRLFPEGDQVVAVLVSNGDQIPDAGKNILGDPMTPYRFSKNQTKKGLLAFYPKPYDAQRTMWRSLDALLVSETDAGFTNEEHAPKRPENLVNFSNISSHQRSHEIADVSIVSMGYGPQSSSVGTVVTGNIGLPLSLLQDDKTSRVQRQYVRDAADVTRNAATSLGWFVGQLAVAAGGENGYSVDAEDRLYTVLEPRFIAWLRGLNLENIEDEAIAWERQIRTQLFQIAEEEVRGAGQKALIGRVVDGGGSIVSAGSLFRHLQYRVSQDLTLLYEYEREEREEQQKGSSE